MAPLRFLATLILVPTCLMGVACAATGQTYPLSVWGAEDQAQWVVLDRPAKDMHGALLKAGISTSYIYPQDRIFGYVKAPSASVNCNGNGSLYTCIIQGEADVQLGNASSIKTYTIRRNPTTNTLCVVSTSANYCSYLNN